MSGDVAVRACHAYGTGSTAAIPATARARIIPQLAAPLPVIWTPRIRWSAARSITQFLPKLALRWFQPQGDNGAVEHDALHAARLGYFAGFPGAA